jgi:hypothetical protein
MYFHLCDLFMLFYANKKKQPPALHLRPFTKPRLRLVNFGAAQQTVSRVHSLEKHNMAPSLRSKTKREASLALTQMLSRRIHD